MRTDTRPPTQHRLPFAFLIMLERRRQSISQEQLARRVGLLAEAEHVYCGVRRQTINRYERGRIVPTPDTVRWLAKALDLPTSQLVVAAERQRAIAQRGFESQTRASESPPTVPADDGANIPWTLAGTLAVVREWLSPGTAEPIVTTIPSASVATTAKQYLALDPVVVTDLTAPGADDGLLDNVNHGVRLIRMMDDANGGASHIAYTEAYFRALIVFLRENADHGNRNRHLNGVLAQLAQQAGWMAYDANRPGTAQRYYLAGLRFAHEAGDRLIAAHILADLALQASSSGDVRDALVIGDAALRAGHGSPGGVYASLLARTAHVHAMAGRLEELERDCFAAHESLVRRRVDHEPEWMYYMTPSHIDGIAGVSLVDAGRRLIAAGDPGGGERLLVQGEALLRKGRAQVRALDRPHQRRALFEEAWLALACSTQGNLQEACEAAGMAMRRLQGVKSPRSVAVLRAVAADLRRRARERHVKEFLPELDRALGDDMVSR